MPECTNVKDLGELTQTAANVARDAAYVVVGLGVMGVQRAQVQRVALGHKLGDTVSTKLGRDLDVTDKVDEAVKLATKQVQQLDGLVERAVRFVETSLEPLEEQLPGVARDLAKRAHDQVRVVRTQIRERVVPAA